MRHGTGAINVDGCRVAGGEGYAEEVARNVAAFARVQQNTPGWKNSSPYKPNVEGALKGRWPANLVLQHLDGCVRNGVKKVKVIGATAHRKDHGTKGLMGWEGQPHEGFRDPDGTETVTVTAWACAPGCPVAALDAQSGVTKDGVAVHRNGSNTTPNPSSWDKPRIPMPDIGYGGGGASRFFKQIGGSCTTPTPRLRTPDGPVPPVDRQDGG